MSLKDLLRPPSVPDEPPSEGAIEGTKVAMGGCGVTMAAAFLGCFPLVVVISAVAAWTLPVLYLRSTPEDAAIDVLDQLSIAEDMWFGQHGAYFAGPPWPEGSVVDPGDRCLLSVLTPTPDTYEATVACPAEAPEVHYVSSDSTAPAPR